MKSKLTIFLLISLFIVSGTYAQNKKQGKKIVLKGLVVDAENTPIQFASVFVDGKNCNIQSDANGRFRMKIKPTAESITVFTLFNGVEEIAYQGEEEMTFVLTSSDMVQQDPLNKSDKEESDLINVGYGTAHKSSITTSVGEVNKSRFKNTQHYINIYDMIKGEVPGVVVSGTNITIRGISSITLSSQPLFVVNGSPTTNITDISPNDVKSISVLKGAAAAIYGSRGTNGVILITLKSANDN